MISQTMYEEGGEKATESYSDYKKVEGIMFAHERKTQSTQGNIASKVTKISVNPKVPDELFATPAD